MVATDTVVGIIGAVVLVAVMAGVFVYEYNNAPEGGSAAAQVEHFESDFAGMDGTADLDGDGTPNYLDNDIDGDGVNNTDDQETTQVIAVSGSVPAPPPTGAGTPYTQPFTVQNGSVHFQGSLTYTRTNCQVASPNMEATITGPASFSVTGAATCSGNTVTITFNVEETLQGGDYTLAVRQLAAGGVVPVGQAASVAGTLEVHYPALEEGHDDH